MKKRKISPKVVMCIDITSLVLTMAILISLIVLIWGGNKSEYPSSIIFPISLMVVSLANIIPTVLSEIMKGNMYFANNENLVLSKIWFYKITDKLIKIVCISIVLIALVITITFLVLGFTDDNDLYMNIAVTVCLVACVIALPVNLFLIDRRDKLSRNKLIEEFKEVIAQEAISLEEAKSE